MSKNSSNIKGGTDYPSGRPGGSENVWNFKPGSTAKDAVEPHMRKSLGKFTKPRKS